MTEREFDRRFQENVDLINKTLPDYLPSQDCAQGKVIEAMAYSLLGGGKRIRAVLLLECYRACGGMNLEAVLPFAAAVEMVHAYSLIHDDLPCMDDDDLRRGKPACHIAYGEAIALLAGDGLLNMAFETVCRADREIFMAERILTAVHILSAAAGVQGMIGGQVMDLENENAAITLNRLKQTDLLKTGALIKASAAIGCLLAGSDDKQRAAVEQYAKYLGLMFQIIDDVLDQGGDQALMGKPVGSDTAKNKATYSTIMGPEDAAETAMKLNMRAKEALCGGDIEGEFLGMLSDMLLRRKY